MVRIRILLFYLLLINSAFAQSIECPSNENNLKYLLKADPNKVTDRDLESHAKWLEDNYQAFHQNYGILNTATYAKPSDCHPSFYSAGGDNAIFTGMYLSSAIFRWKVTRSEVDLDKVLNTLRGLHILTHISGIPGVLARLALPVDEASKYFYPEKWAARIAEGFAYTSSDNIPDILNPSRSYPKMIFYTRTSRDQLSGVLYGLSVAWSELHEGIEKNENEILKIKKAKKVIIEITESLYRRLKSQNYVIRDQRGETGINASKVDGYLKLSLFALRRAIKKEIGSVNEFKRADKKYQDQFFNAFYLGEANFSDLFNGWANYGSYYVWNLRILRVFGIWLLEDDASRSFRIMGYTRSQIWKYIKTHQNTFYNFTYFAIESNQKFSTTEKLDNQLRMEQAIYSLKSLSLRPIRSFSSPLQNQTNSPPLPIVLLPVDHSSWIISPHLRKPTGYTTWQKEPWDVGEGTTDHEGLEEATGLDFLIAYWLGRYMGYLNLEN